ncbi:helix-turn-helix domain-containing protein [Microbacterium oryzae]|uniref:XRE family transcriptional regulator n=1 Tax=Microbacterium oryzae TaxID=743009 RepID=UPI0025B1C496|nr:XRE family transcriptional regulator [Microbacterium oryzae]MDN3312003.1 helix-turn-helix domain-containing protein [Microbacterium oryzae]
MSPSIPLKALLRQHRLDRDLTMETLSARSGISDRTIGDIERGVSTTPQRHTVTALADALSLDGHERDAFFDAARARRRSTPADEDDEVARLRPHWIDDFTGRDDDVARIVELLGSTGGTRSAAAPIIISGTPGIGKTSVAVEALRRGRPDGCRELFLDLQGVGERPLTPLQVLLGLLRQLTDGKVLCRSFADAADAWREATARTPVMVILDDAALEAQVRPVLSADSRSRVLVTSRRTLPGIEGAQHICLRPFTREHSLTFLRSAIPSTQRTDGSIDELAELCSDLPLALRVAAGRISSQPTRTAADFVRRLRAKGTRLELLVAGDLAVERAFSASYEALPADIRSLFQDLALLDASPSFSADAASAVHGTETSDTQDLLDRLVDLGMVEPLYGGRYRLHELLRLFAARRLEAERSAEEIGRRVERLDRWMLDTAARCGRAFARSGTGADRDEAGQWLTTEVDYWWGALRRAAADGEHEHVRDAAAGIRWFGDRWLEWGHWNDFFTLFAAAAEALGDVRTQADALGDVAYMHLFETFDYQRAGIAARRSLDLATAVGDQALRGWALTHLSGSATFAGNAALGADHAREAVTAFHEAGNLEGELQARQALADVLRHTNPEDSLAELERVLAIAVAPATDIDEHYRTSTRDSALAGAARTLLVLGRHDDAIRVATELASETDDDSYQARAMRHRGFASMGLGRLQDARTDLTLAIELAGPHRPDEWAAEIEEALAQIDESASTLED